MTPALRGWPVTLLGVALFACSGGGGAGGSGGDAGLRFDDVGPASFPTADAAPAGPDVAAPDAAEASEVEDLDLGSTLDIGPDGDGGAPDRPPPVEDSADGDVGPGTGTDAEADADAPDALSPVDPCLLEPSRCLIDGSCWLPGESPADDACVRCDPTADEVAWTLVTCADDNPCTSDGCVPASGCVHLTDDALPCDDGDPCSGDDHCLAGECVGTPCQCDSDADCAAIYPHPPDCTRAACQGQTCALVADTAVNGEGCDDADACTDSSICAGGVCSFGQPLDCSGLDQGVCAPGACDPAAGGCVVTFLADGAPCDDGDACTAGDACAAGACHGGAAVACEDGDVCNGIAACDPLAGCVQGVSLVCDDGDPCDGLEACDPVDGCVLLQPPLVCDDGDVCNGVFVCDSGVGCVLVEPALQCDDGDACNGAEVCLPVAGCKPGTPPVCGDGDPCNGAESCDPDLGCVGGAPPWCDDGDVCDGLESCEPGVGCVDGLPLVCGDDDACNGVEACDPAAGCVSPGPPLCDDGDPCNGTETCDPATGCAAGTPPECGDFACGPAGCPAGCASAAECQPGLFCDTADVDGDGDAAECLPPSVDGGPCDVGTHCGSGYCQGGVCCTGGPLCCASDLGCPASPGVGGPSQGSESPLLFAEISPESAAAQRFVPEWPGSLTHASARIFGNPAIALTATLRVQAGAPPGEPGSATLAQATFEVTGLGDYVVTLSPAAHLTAGEPHWLVVTGELFPPKECGPTGCTSSFVLWYGTSDSDSYPAGETWLSADSGSSYATDPLGGDRAFTTTMTVQGCLDHVCVEP